MSKNYGLAVFSLLLLVLFGLVWLKTGSVMPPPGNDSIWFHAGLFTLLVGRFITEYRFTKPNDVFINCLVVFASISTLENPANAVWWELLRWSALILGVSAIALAWDLGSQARLTTSRWRSIAYKIVTRVGKAEVIFSIVFVLALVSFFNLSDVQTRIFAVVWGVFLLAAHLDIAEIGVSLLGARRRNRNLVGVVHSFNAPSVVFCTRLGDSRIPDHKLVGFCQGFASTCHAFGVVIGERSSASEARIAIALLNSTVDGAELSDRSVVVTLSDADSVDLANVASQDDIDSIKRIVGTVADGTTIGQLRVEIFGQPPISAGSLLNVRSGDVHVFYQVFDGRIDEEQTHKESSRAFVEGQAEQVGVWNSERGGFETFDWLAKERSPVTLIDENSDAPTFSLKPTEVTIGHVPKSRYPVNVDIEDMTLFHSAILGVTGAGKSYLSYQVVEACAARGIKVVCVDPTGDYQRYLSGAVLLNRTGALTDFLNSPSHNIGILETARHALNPAAQTSKLAGQCLDWCRAHRSDEEVLTPSPKVLVVLEEAHLLVPEWNSNPVREMQDRVNATSQVVLQARKYGLGFMVVSQRTANVTKSILNQCNTIVSFQAFDETGFDFLKHYMGAFHVSSIPNLKPRHGILVGKASRSRRPIMVRLLDQERSIQTAPAPDMPAPTASTVSVPAAH